jgi:hypothetical protein
MVDGKKPSNPKGTADVATTRVPGKYMHGCGNANNNKLIVNFSLANNKIDQKTANRV